MDGVLRGRMLLAALVVLAGCSAVGGITTFEADAAEVSEAVVAETDYEYNGTDEQTVRRTFEVAGSEQRVTVTNRIATYDKAVEVPGAGSRRLAAVAVLSSPSIGLAGQEFNPIANFTPQDLAAMLTNRREGLTVERRAGDSSVRTLGTTTTVSRFAGSQSLGPTDQDVIVQVTKVKHEGDFVAVLAVSPERIDDRETIERMIGALVHPA